MEHVNPPLGSHCQPRLTGIGVGVGAIVGVSVGEGVGDMFIGVKVEVELAVPCGVDNSVWAQAVRSITIANRYTEKIFLFITLILIC